MTQYLQSFLHVLSSSQVLYTYKNYFLIKSSQLIAHACLAKVLPLLLATYWQVKSRGAWVEKLPIRHRYKEPYRTRYGAPRAPILPPRREQHRG